MIKYPTTNKFQISLIFCQNFLRGIDPYNCYTIIPLKKADTGGSPSGTPPVGGKQYISIDSTTIDILTLSLPTKIEETDQDEQLIFIVKLIGTDGLYNGIIMIH